MSFWVGAAKAFGEYKEEEFAREQAQADRDFRINLQDRDNKAAMARTIASRRADFHNRMIEKRMELEKEAETEATRLRMARRLYGDTAAAVMVDSGTLNAYTDDSFVRTLDQDTINSIQYNADRFVNQVPEEDRPKFVDSLLQGRGSLDWFAELNIDATQPGALGGDRPASGVQVIGEARRQAASMVGADFDVTPSGEVKFIPRQDQNLGELEELALAIANRVEALQNTTTLPDAFIRARQEFSSRLGDFGFDMTPIDLGDPNNAEEGTQSVFETFDPSRPLGER